MSKGIARQEAKPQTIERTSSILIDSAALGKKDSLHILHVDDDPCILEVSKQILEIENNFEVDTALSVEEAFKRMEKQSFDVVVSDYQMPQKNGLQFLQELREKRNSIPFIMFTGKSREEVAVMALNLGADGYYNKQGSPETVYGELSHGICIAAERLKTKAALEESEKRYRTLMEQAAEAIFVHDTTGQVVDVNQQACKSLGYTREELLSMNIADTDAEATENKKGGLFWPKVLAGQSVTFESTHKRKDGSTFPVEVTLGSTTLDKEIAVIGLVRDITERKKTRESLEKKQHELDSIIDSSPIIIFYKDKEGKFIRVNKTFAETLKIPKEEFLGKTVFDLYSAKIAQGMANDDSEALKSGHPKLGIIEQYESASGIRWVQTDKVPIFDKNGIPAGLVGFAQDITERKLMDVALQKSNERFKQVMEHVEEFVWEVDAAGVYTYVSSVVEKMLGYKPEEVVGKKRFYDFFHPDDEEELKKKAFSVLDKKDSFKGLINRNVARNGSIVWLSTSGVPIVADDGKLLGYRGVDVNITERKRTEELLKDSVAKYRDFAESLPEIVFEIDAKGNLVFVNQKASQITGYSQDEFGNNFNFIRLVVPDEREKAIANIKRLLSGENVGSNEYNLVKKDGAVFPVMIWATPRIVQNKVAGLRGIVVDISEHKKAEEVLRRSEEKYRELVNSLPEIVFEADLTGKITFFSQRALEITGFTREELEKGLNILSFVVPEERERAMENMKKSLAGEYHGANEYTLLRKNGTTYPALVRTTPIFSENKVTGLRGLVIDITERKKAEEERESGENYLKAIFKSVLTGIIIINAETHEIVDANPQALETLGASKEQTVGKICHKFVCPAEKGKCPISDLGQVVDKSERTLLSLDGEKIPILKTVMEMSWKGQKYLVESFINITDRKKAEEALNQVMDQLVLVNEKVEVVGSLTRHDVRNKLSAMTGYAYLLKKKHADQADILDGVSKMEQAVKDIVAIFDFAKMYEQLGVEELKYINAEKALNEAIALFSGSSSLEFINDCHGLSLLADSLLTQLFYNLIDNSLKHGEKVTKIRVHYEKADQDELIVVFEDDGVGISAENKPKLFKEGFSTSGTSGYGLFLMRKMMSVYGWSIQENGELGKGAKFTMTIPRINQNGKENFQIA